MAHHETNGTRDGDGTIYTCPKCDYMIRIPDHGPPERISSGDPAATHSGSVRRDGGPGRVTMRVMRDGQQWRWN